MPQINFVLEFVPDCFSFDFVPYELLPREISTIFADI
jgi:hypothetical protein